MISVLETPSLSTYHGCSNDLSIAIKKFLIAYLRQKTRAASSSTMMKVLRLNPFSSETNPRVGIVTGVLASINVFLNVEFDKEAPPGQKNGGGSNKRTTICDVKFHNF